MDEKESLESQQEYTLRSVLTGHYNWIPEPSPILSYSNGDFTIKLPTITAHMEFAGEYYRPIAFPLLRLFHEKNIDSIIQAELTELTPEALAEWTQWQHENPRSAMIMDDDYFWNTLHTEYFVNESDFSKHRLLQEGLKKYGDNHYRHQPGYLALHVYADPEKLLAAYRDQGISVWTVERKEQWDKDAKAVRAALLTGDFRGMASFIEKSIRSGEVPIEIPEEKIKDISQDIASAFILSTDKGDKQSKH